MAEEEEEPDWMTPYKNFLIRGVLLSNENEAWRLKRKANYYVILDGKLFKIGLTTPLLKCWNNQQANYVMRELHEGICDLHIRGCSLATEMVFAWYYWPTLKANIFDFTRRCRRCQEFIDVPHTSLNNLHSPSSPWPFTMWGMDILGPLPKAPRAVKFLLVIVDFFTKWIKARPLWEISSSEVEKFTWKHLMCRYGLPYTIITNNGTQFKAQAYEEFLMRLGVKHLMTSVKHPKPTVRQRQPIGSSLNRCAPDSTSPRVYGKRNSPNILWAYHCSPQTTTNETPLWLTYGSDAMIPNKVGELSTRRLFFQEQHNEEKMRVELETKDEVQEMTRI